MSKLSEDLRYMGGDSYTNDLGIAAADRIEQLEDKLATVTAERDAAVRDTKHDDCCTVCIGSGVPEDDCTWDCAYCELLCRCRDCLDGSEYRWRGVQQEGSTP